MLIHVLSGSAQPFSLQRIVDKFVSRQSYYLVVPRVKIISFVIVFGSFFFQVDYSICAMPPAPLREHLISRISLWFAGVSGVIWFPRQYSQPDYFYGKRKDKLIKSVVFGSLLAR